LVEGNTGAALRILSKLEQLPARALAPEATVLRVRALLARGDTVEAKRVVERFCVVAPSSPQAGILRTLIADSEIQAAPSRL
jgi:outer membrane protein assembly factor BamD (BamD/ComL family)